MNPSNTSGTATGTLATDPIDVPTQERTLLYWEFDPELEQMVMRHRLCPAGTARVLSLVIHDTALGRPYVLRCIDYDASSRFCKKGDHVRVMGYLEDLSDSDDEHDKASKQLVIEALAILSSSPAS